MWPVEFPRGRVTTLRCLFTTPCWSGAGGRDVCGGGAAGGRTEAARGRVGGCPTGGGRAGGKAEVRLEDGCGRTSCDWFDCSIDAAAYGWNDEAAARSKRR